MNPAAQNTETLTTAPMPLVTAERYANAIMEWLLPFCERITTVGSIRRRRPMCGDVDLVLIPRFEIQRDLLGATIGRVNLVWKELVRYVARSDGTAHWLAGEDRIDGRNYVLQLPKCQLDIFCARPKTWGTLVVCRTGSKEHNIWLASRAKSMGGHWDPYLGVLLHGQWQPVSTEEEVYRAVGLELIPPEKRELEYLRKLP